MFNPHTILTYHQPDFVSRRGEASLFVWGDLGQWLVVDEELAAFMPLFDGKRTIVDAIREYAAQKDIPVETAEQEVAEIIPELVKRGILSDGNTPSIIQEEALSIANLTLNITNRCNLACTWCYNSERNTPEMPIEGMMDAIEAGKHQYDSKASLIILGGEPLLDWPRLKYALERSASLFSKPVMFSTNGTLLTEDIAAQLAQLNCETQVSLDGPSPEIHDAIRGAGVFDTAVAGIRCLVDAGAYTILSMVYTNDTLGEFEKYLALALSLGVDEARLIPMRAIGRGTDCARQLPDQKHAFDTLMALLQRRPEFKRLLQRDFFSILSSVCERGNPRSNCGIARRVLFVDADGSVYPCPNHVSPEYLCGNLASHTIQDIVEKSPCLENLRAIYDVAHFDSCCTCSFRYWCAGDCRGEVLSLCGSKTKPSPHCEELRAVIPELMWTLAASTKD